MAMNIVTKYDDICLLCGKKKECGHHLISGTANRKMATEDLLIVPLCNNCHNFAVKSTQRIHGNEVAEKLSKMLGQMAWEKQKVIEGVKPESVRDEFRKRYGKSFL